MAERTTDPRPRIPDGLAARIDEVRGDVLFGTWVVRACELRLAGALEAASGIPEHPLVERLKDIPDGPLKPPRAPRKKRNPKVAEPEPAPEVEPDAAPEPPEQREPGDTFSPDAETPSVVQLAQRAGVTLSMARRWLESGEWAMYWP